MINEYPIWYSSSYITRTQFYLAKINKKQWQTFSLYFFCKSVCNIKQLKKKSYPKFYLKHCNLDYTLTLSSKSFVCYSLDHRCCSTKVKDVPCNARSLFCTWGKQERLHWCCDVITQPWNPFPSQDTSHQADAW